MARMVADHYLYIYFYKVHSSTPWKFSCTGFSAMSDLKIISRAPLLRILFMVQYLQHFCRGFQNGPVKLRPFPRGLAWLIHRYYWWSLILFPGCCVYKLSCLEVLAEFCSSLSYLFSWGISKVLGHTDSQMQSMYWEVLFLTSFLSVHDREGFDGPFHLLSNRLYFVAVFTHVLQGGEN